MESLECVPRMREVHVNEEVIQKSVIADRFHSPQDLGS
jgi:hypothetical protein